MTTGNEKIEEKLEDFNLTLFTIPDESAFIPPKGFKEETKEEEKEKEDENDDEDISTDIDDIEKEEKEEDKDDQEKEEKQEEVELSDVDKTLSSLLEQGILLLPDDYEYEDSKEGLQKAFEDSENYRNQIAFQEAVKYLSTKEGSKLIKIKEAAEKVESYQNIETEKLSEDSKIEIIKNFYKAKEYDTDDIEQIIEDLVESDTKLDKELGIAIKYLKKEEEKEIENRTKEIERAKAAELEAYKKSQTVIKDRLKQKSDYNGYVINEANHDRIFNATFKPVKLEDGTVTNEVTKMLSDVMNNPEEYLVLVDLLLSRTEKGFNFGKIETKAETTATQKIKKSIRDFKNTSIKNKTNGRNSQTQTDFDLSKASLGFKY